ncbi:hypothetical protein C7453_1168 [Gluconacetobacter liquefaciens]|uniref:Uncharacterized protein n=1 Tax=Gluconacetobacter liquefaciens TaxID=89584 RepID=A0A370FXD5_GLULI|nr:hypothetical protein C7453_1168 [Gluconacetobacter liquefaciens]
MFQEALWVSARKVLEAACKGGLPSERAAKRPGV